uniref:CCHC-type domain-containing protein n=1 Tax=Nicotiana tabacum TaxID=4097 RepID=A0A1S4B2F0_TOBAC
MVHTLEREEREAKRSRGPGNSSGVPFGGQSYHSKGRPYRPAYMAHPAHRGASAGHGLYSARPISFGSYSGSRGPPQNVPPFFVMDCYECGELGHVRKYCPCLSRGPVLQRSQATTHAPAATPPTQPDRGEAQAARGLPRGE